MDQHAIIDCIVSVFDPNLSHGHIKILSLNVKRFPAAKALQSLGACNTEATNLLRMTLIDTKSAIAIIFDQLLALKAA